MSNSSGAGNLFDGNLTSFYGPDGNTQTWTPANPIEVKNQVRIFYSSGSTSRNFEVNDNGNVIVTGTGIKWVDLEFTGKLTKISGSIIIGWNVSSIEIDGVTLVDSVTENIAFGNSGWYLPMDGKTPIGKDQSGNGNDWTPVGFGGSVDLPNATGAIPILNTNDAGTVAKTGVRTDKKTYTVTASGGNYYIDGALKPTLNAYRGGSYTFDYTAAGGHPFYLSSLQDGKHNSKAYSVEFDGTGDSCSIGPSSDFTMGTGDFTIECFVQKDNIAHQGILQISDTAGGFATTNYGTTLAIGYQLGVWQIYGNSTQIESASYSIATGRWYHLAYVRHNGVASSMLMAKRLYLKTILITTTELILDMVDIIIHHIFTMEKYLT